MSSFNKVVLMGNLGKDPEVKTFEKNKKASFSLATSETFKKDGEKQTKTEWHNIVCWSGVAELAEKYLKKGSSILVEGKITYRNYEKDEKKVYVTEIVATDIRFIDTHKEETKEAVNSESVDDTNDLPF
jgi:single-strand DNA-binding protein